MPPVTLEELEQLATAHNPTLVQLAMRIRAAQGEQLQAGLYPNPIVGYLGEEMGQDGQAGKQGAFFAQEFV
ncbi:MAG: TolC family protein, partial [Thermoguttaceae bacterium]